LYETVGFGGVSVWLLESDNFFNRDGFYHDSSYNDFLDNPSRFAFLSNAALQMCIDTQFSPDIVHCHDWQSSLALAYLKTWYWNNPIVGRAAGVLTVHNAQYQGTYSRDNYGYMGFGWQHWTSDKFEDNGHINMLKAGIHFADAANTVSPTHAKEIASPHSEFGLAPYFSAKGECFNGILNGVDYEEWNPQKDMFIKQHFSSKGIAGKRKCKKDLQERFYLKVDENIPVIGIVGRMASQKGYDLLTPVLENILDEFEVQLVIVGSGDKALEGYFGWLPSKYCGKFGSWIGYSNELAHIVEAGSDMFLMPSRFEPCGLNQMYSLKYGTLPIVRRVGGLADSVDNYNPNTGNGTGFVFDEASPQAIYGTVKWAIETWYQRREHFEGMQIRAMEVDFSWNVAGKQYIDLYHRAKVARVEYDNKHLPKK
jgi:starch synthase